MTTSLTLHRYTAIDQIDPEEWDAVALHTPFTQYRWVDLATQIIKDWEPWFLIWRDGDTPVAAAICFRQRRFHLSAHRALQHGERLLRSILPRMAPLTCGLPVFGSYSGLLTAPDISAEWHNQLIADVEQEAKQAGVVWAAFDSVNDLRMRRLEPRYLRYATAEEAILELGAVADIHDFEMTLAKKKRSEVRRLRNRAQEAGVTVSAEPLHAAHQEDMRRLITETATQHGNSFLYHPDFVERATAVIPPEDSRLLLVHKAGKIIGTVTVFKQGRHGLLKWIGLDYSETEGSYAYHYLMIESVAAAIDLGVETFNLGGRAWTMKKHLGAVPSPRFVALRWRYPIMRAVVERFVVNE